MVKKRVGISGKITSGKTTCSDYLVSRYGHERVSLARPLKSMANWWRGYQVAVGDEKLKMENDLFHKLCKEIFFGDYQKGNKAFELLTEGIFPKYTDIDWNIEKGDKWRELLQNIGQEFRVEIDPDTWVRYMISTMKEDGFYVCDDIRYVNEFHLMEEANFTIIRLEVSQAVQAERVVKIYGEVSPDRFIHQSEIDLDHTTFKHTVNADQDLFVVLDDICRIVEGGPSC